MSLLMVDRHPVLQTCSCRTSWEMLFVEKKSRATDSKAGRTDALIVLSGIVL